MYGHLVTTYESASTRRFLQGRVDCIRGASTEALEWAKAMCQGEGANVNLESDKEDESDARKVKFNIYSVSNPKIFYKIFFCSRVQTLNRNIQHSTYDRTYEIVTEDSMKLVATLTFRSKICFLSW